MFTSFLSELNRITVVSLLMHWRFLYSKVRKQILIIHTHVLSLISHIYTPTHSLSLSLPLSHTGNSWGRGGDGRKEERGGEGEKKRREEGRSERYQGSRRNNIVRPCCKSPKIQLERADLGNSLHPTSKPSVK